jgi:hypothetical protein
VVRRDNNPRRDLTPRGIVHAIAKLLAAQVPLIDQFIIVSHCGDVDETSATKIIVVPTRWITPRLRRSLRIRRRAGIGTLLGRAGDLGQERPIGPEMGPAGVVRKLPRYGSVEIKRVDLMKRSAALAHSS